MMLLAVLKLFFIFPEVVKAQRPAVEATARQLTACSVSDPERRGRQRKMLNLALDAMKRADGIDPQTRRALPAGYSQLVQHCRAHRYRTAYQDGLRNGVVIWMFIGFALSFAIERSPMFPFHTWLPDALRCANRGFESYWLECC